MPTQVSTQVPFPEPRGDEADPARLLRRYLAYYHSELARRVTALDGETVRATPLPSGWSPLELAQYLVHMEQRWLIWGFAGEPVHDPWGDSGGAVDAPWQVAPETTATGVLTRLDDVARRTDDLLATTPLDRLARLGGRFTEQPPTLAWICFHVLQEWARHLGQLDVAVELLGGPTGEPAG